MESRIKYYTSYDSLNKGIEYYEENKVKSVEQIGKNLYRVKVEGSNNNLYEVILNDKKPRTSTCTCPYCQEQQLRFCKHKVAALFKVDKEEYDCIIEADKKVYEEFLKRNKEYNKRCKEIPEKAKELALKEINKMDAEKIKKELYKRLVQEKNEVLKDNLEYEFRDILY